MTWRSAYEPRFVQAVEKVLRHEGFFSDDENDPGGATKYGVSLRWLRRRGAYGDFDGDGDVDRDDVWAMTEADAVAAYHRFWWVEEGYDALDLMVGAKIFDLAINMGPRPANRILQRAVRAARGPVLADDGILGPATRAAAAACPAHELRIAARSEAAGHYRLLVTKRPAFALYEKGWLNRAYS